MTILKLADGSQYNLTTAGFYYADSDKKTIGLELIKYTLPSIIELLFTKDNSILLLLAFVLVLDTLLFSVMFP